MATRVCDQSDGAPFECVVHGQSLGARATVLGESLGTLAAAGACFLGGKPRGRGCSPFEPERVAGALISSSSTLSAVSPVLAEDGRPVDVRRPSGRCAGRQAMEQEFPSAVEL